jgi:hypothetical protein
LRSPRPASSFRPTVRERRQLGASALLLCRLKLLPSKHLIHPAGKCQLGVPERPAVRVLRYEADEAAAAASAASGQCVLARSSLSWPSLHNRPAEFYLNTSPTLVIRTPGPRWKGHECPMPTAKCCICPLLRPESKAFWPSTPATRKTLGSVSSSPLGPTPAWAFVLWRFRPASCLTVARS